VALRLRISTPLMRRISPAVGMVMARSVAVHHGRFQRGVADELANAGFDAIEAAQDLHRALHAGGFQPATDSS